LSSLLLRKGIPEMPGVKVKIAGSDDDGDASHMNVNVFGDPGPRLTSLAEDVRRRVSLVPGVQGVERGNDRGSKEIEVFVQRDRAARYGLTADDVASSVALFFRGRPLSRFRGPDGEVQMQARLSEADRQSLGRLRSTYLGYENDWLRWFDEAESRPIREPIDDACVRSAAVDLIDAGEQYVGSPSIHLILPTYDAADGKQPAQMRDDFAGRGKRKDQLPVARRDFHGGDFRAVAAMHTLHAKIA